MFKRSYVTANTALLLLVMLCFNFCNTPDPKDAHIKPWSENPRYWQYKGQPVLLLGGSNDDNLFQWTSDMLIPHLDSMVTIGANYVRNTMSDRPDTGFEIKAFKLLESGKYDLNLWNDEYWQRFEFFLEETYTRDIIVQIEVWDRFDHSTHRWETNPYNPLNNINYSMNESGLDSIYPVSATRNLQPFFFTVPELNNNQLLLKFQEAFVKKMLSISLEYNHVLYCMDNETSGAEEWSAYWAEFIRENSGNKDIYLTEMWDKWDVKDTVHNRTYDKPERYEFIDISQNSHNTGRVNWDNAQYVFSYTAKQPRPINSTKIYGRDDGIWVNRGINTEHAIQTFCRNITGGFASSRFHRPPAGLGLSEPSINCIRTIRSIEEKVKLWDINPMMHLLEGADDNQAYLAAKDGEKYLVYFPEGARVRLDLKKHRVPFQLQWISTDSGSWSNAVLINGGDMITLEPPETKSCFAILTIQK